jgi:hypothetical protein
MFCDTLCKAAHLWFHLMQTNHQYLQKYVGRIQNLCSSPKSVARRKKITGDCKVSKSAQVPGLPFEESFEPNQDVGLVRCPSCPQLTQKMSYGLTQTVDFVAWPPKTQPKSPMTGECQHEVPLVQGNLASQLTINTKKVFLPH